MNNLKPCRFYFGDDPTYDGFTDGTTWNGFDNIWVTPEVHKQVMADHPIEDPENNYWDIEPDDDGLISYSNGFATSVEAPKNPTADCGHFKGCECWKTY